MKRRMLAIVAGLVVALGGSAALVAQQAGGGEQRDPPFLLDTDFAGFAVFEQRPAAPDIAIADASGESVGFDAFAGKLVVVNFWATWCAPCVHEMPTLDALAARYADRPVVVLAISQDRGGAEAGEPFLDQLEVGHLVRLYDPQNTGLRNAGLRGLPTTLLLDPQGREIGRLQGEADWNGEGALRLIDHYLPEAEG